MGLGLGFLAPVGGSEGIEKEMESIVLLGNLWGFAKIRGTFLRATIIRILGFEGLYWVPLFRETTI